MLLSQLPPPPLLKDNLVSKGKTQMEKFTDAKNGSLILFVEKSKSKKLSKRSEATTLFITNSAVLADLSQGQ